MDSECPLMTRRVVILALIALLCGRHFASFPRVNPMFARLRKSATKRRMWRASRISGFRRTYERDRASDYAAHGAAMILETWVQTSTI